MDDMNEISSSNISKINSAALINLLLSDLWRESYRHSRAGRLSEWNADLNCLWIEFGGDLKEDDKGKKKIDEFNKIEKEIGELGSLFRRKTGGFEAESKDELLNKTKQYKLLMKKALFLKKLQNKQGKGTAYQDDADDYMD